LCGKCKCKSVGRSGMCRYVYYGFEWLCAKNMIDIGRLQHRIRFSDGGLNRLMQHTCPDLMFSHSHLPRTSTLFPTDPPIFKTQSHKVKATSRPPSLSRPAISKSYTPFLLIFPTHPHSHFSPFLEPRFSGHRHEYISPTLAISLLLSSSQPSFHTLTFPTHFCLDLS
jgi:hypothetical protein